MDKDKENALKTVSLKAEEFLTALELVSGTFNESEKQELRNLVSSPIGLRDTGKFNLPLNIDSRADIQQARRDLSGAIAAQKWQEGFTTALKIMLLLGG